MKHRFFLFVGIVSTGLYAADSELAISSGATKKDNVSATELFGSFIKVEADGEEAKEVETLYRSCACGPGPGGLESLNKELKAAYFWEDPNGAGLRIKRTELSKAKPGDLDYPREGEPGYVASAPFLVPPLSLRSLIELSLPDGGSSYLEEVSDGSSSEDRVVQAMDSDIQNLLNTQLGKKVVAVWKWFQS